MDRAMFWTAVVAVVLAGCAGKDETKPTPGPAPPETFWDPMLEGEGHDHRDPAQHQGSLNMSLVAFHKIVANEGHSAGAHSVEVWKDLVAVKIQGDAGYGFDILDLAGEPRLVGRFRDASSVGGDRAIAWSDDGKFVFVANEASAGGNPNSAGVKVVNVANPKSPTLASHYTIYPSGVHTIFAKKIADVQYVYAINYGVHILRLEGEGNNARLLPVGKYVTASVDQLRAVNDPAPDVMATRRDIYGHDMSVHEDAKTGKVIMYVAYAYEGFTIVDITNPSAPLELAHWVPPGNPRAHYVHSVQTFVQEKGRRISVVGSETFEDWNVDKPSPIWILDTSDLANPTLLATWTNPGNHGSQNLLLSVHFFRVHEEKLYLTHYHGGLWVLDLADPAHPTVAGFYMTAEAYGYRPPVLKPIGSPFNTGGAPFAYDVAMHGADAVVADEATGLYVVRLNATR